MVGKIASLSYQGKRDLESERTKMEALVWYTATIHCIRVCMHSKIHVVRKRAVSRISDVPIPSAKHDATPGMQRCLLQMCVERRKKRRLNSKIKALLRLRNGISLLKLRRISSMGTLVGRAAHERRSRRALHSFSVLEAQQDGSLGNVLVVELAPLFRA